MNIYTPFTRPSGLPCGIMPAALTPSEVMTLLGVSDATLRRMARAYERVYGRMPTDARQARIYSSEVMNVLEDARQRVADGKAASFEKAIEGIAAGEPGESLAVSAPPQALEALRAELRLVIKQEVTAALQEHHAARDAELERRNAYLEAELKRRDEVVPRRGWWPWGKR